MCNIQRLSAAIDNRWPVGSTDYIGRRNKFRQVGFQTDPNRQFYFH
jgi:hypothetical protein